MKRVVFQHPFTCIIAGPTQSGKTTFVSNLLNQSSTLIEPSPDQITYCYSCYQDAYKQLENLPIKFVKGLPSIDEFDPNVNNLIILDDLMEQCEKDKEILNLFTVDSHHQYISTIFITHNLYSRGKYMRTINLNAHYLVLFNNPRDPSQLNHLARQMFPTNSKYLIESYQDAVSKPYGYLFIGLKQSTDNNHRVKTGILLTDKYYIFYVPKDN